MPPRLRDNIQGFKKPQLERLAHRAGAKSLAGDCYEELRGVIKLYTESVVREALTNTEHRRAKTVSVDDMLVGVKRATGVTIAKSTKATTKKCKA